MKRLECKAVFTIDCEDETSESIDFAIDKLWEHLETISELQKLNFKVSLIEPKCVYCCKTEDRYEKYCDQCEYKNSCTHSDLKE